MPSGGGLMPSGGGVMPSGGGGMRSGGGGMPSAAVVPRQLFALLLLTAAVAAAAGQFQFPGTKQHAVDKSKLDRCFCQLEGQVDDCECSVDTVDHFNNVKIYPRLTSLLSKDFFRFYKVNLQRSCPFWEDDGRCSQVTCRVHCCREEEVPIGLKAAASVPHAIKSPSFKYSAEAQQLPPVEGPAPQPQLQPQDGATDDCTGEQTLGDLNTTISASRQRRLDDWTAHDDAQSNFCALDDESSADAQFVDLLLNPERFTGYKGNSAWRVWNAIYTENCFRPKQTHGIMDASNLGADPALYGMCLEERVFYRAVSGLHTSITIHLCSDHLLSEGCRGMDSLAAPTERWGPNPVEFHRRFDPALTDGHGPRRLKNLYFVYLLELRALAKAAPYVSQLQFFTGNDEEDAEVREAIADILSVVGTFPSHFDESVLFRGGQQAKKLKDEFQQHFRNITRIMDCVGCDKCKLWGKLQTQGLGTALKILFSGNFDDPAMFSENSQHQRRFQLTRNEIVSLFNAFGRLSTSVRNLEVFRDLER